jgi:hypothetical protein
MTQMTIAEAEEYINKQNFYSDLEKSLNKFYRLLAEQQAQPRSSIEVKDVGTTKDYQAVPKLP